MTYSLSDKFNQIVHGAKYGLVAGVAIGLNLVFNPTVLGSSIVVPTVITLAATAIAAARQKEEPETDNTLRSIFGTVIGTVAACATTVFAAGKADAGIFRPPAMPETKEINLPVSQAKLAPTKEQKITFC